MAENKDKEMNLFDFIVLCFKALGSLIKKLCVWIAQLFRLAIQYYYVMIICLVLGLFGAWVWNKPFATHYTGSVTIRFPEGMKHAVEQGLFKFLTMDGTEKHDVYGLDYEVMGAVKKMRLYNVIDAKNDSIADYVDRDRNIAENDTMDVVMNDRIHLTLTMLGNKDFAAYEVALKRFFNTDSVLVSNYKRFKERQISRLNYFTHEAARVDSFSTYDYFEKPRYFSAETWGNHLITERKIELYYNDLMLLENNKVFLEEQYAATPEAINFQAPFIITYMPPAWKYCIGIFVGGVLGLIVACIVKYRKKIKEYLKEK